MFLNDTEEQCHSFYMDVHRASCDSWLAPESDHIPHRDPCASPWSRIAEDDCSAGGLFANGLIKKLTSVFPMLTFPAAFS